MGEFNLDAARAARSEAQADRHFMFGGERFELPSELPYEVVERLITTGGMDGKISEATAIAAGVNALPGLLGEAEFDRFRSHRPSAADVNELVDWILREYGLVREVEEGAEVDPKLQTSSAPSS